MSKRPSGEPEFLDPPAPDAVGESELGDTEDMYAGGLEEDDPVGGSEILQVKRKHEVRLCAIDGVVGVGVEQDEIGDEVIMVSLRDAGAQDKIPTQLDGFSVKTKITGEFDAYGAS